jgi:GWxTD domain-containing protein
LIFSRRLETTPGRLGVFCCVVLVLGLVAAPCGALKKKWPEPEEIFNPLLGPQYSHWLVGPIYHMASEKEVEDFQLLVDDAEAKDFIEAFWAKRNAGTKVFTETPQQIFEGRAAEADKRFTEGAYPGSRTDRGAVFILYGEPEDIEFESPQKVGGPTLEVWIYPKNAEAGLDGDKPKHRIRFVEIKERTVFYTGQRLRRDPRDEIRRRPRGF